MCARNSFRQPFIVALFFVCSAIVSLGQSSPSAPGGNSSGGSQSAGGSSAPTPGLIYPKSMWDRNLSALPPPGAFGLGPNAYEGFLEFFSQDTYKKNVVIYCYRLEPSLTGAQPFALIPDRAAHYSENGKNPRLYFLSSGHAPGGLKRGTARQLAKTQRKHELCANFNPNRGLIMDRFLVFRIDMSDPAITDDMRNRFQAISINVSTQAGTSLNSQRGAPLNPTLTRPSLAALSSSDIEMTDAIKEKLNKYTLGGRSFAEAFSRHVPHVYYLTWPIELVGDTTPSVTINLVYTPVAPAKPWTPGTLYPAGSIVTPGSTEPLTGHFYVADNSGVSSGSPVLFDGAVMPVSLLTEGNGSSGVGWLDMGSAGPMPLPEKWHKSTQYASSALVLAAPPNNHYYEAQGPGGKSGAEPPAFPVDHKTVVEVLPGGKKGVTWLDRGPTSVTAPVWTANTAYAVDALVTPPTPNNHYYRAVTAGVSGAYPPAFSVVGKTVYESRAVEWMDIGQALPAGTKLRAWTRGTPYYLGDVIEDPRSGHYYTVVVSGMSGSAAPAFAALPTPTVSDPGTGTGIKWRDLGTSLPSTVTAGTQPPDQTVTALSLTYPQVQVLSRFNLASGGVLNWLRPPTITTCSNSDCPPSVPATCSSAAACYVSTSGSHFFDPILAVSVYAFKPIDAETSFRWSDLYVPALTAGFSLESPTTHFYLGGSSEALMRNLQITYGMGLAQVTSLSKPADGTNLQYSTAEKTGYQHAAYVGFTFDITGFIQSLFPIS